MKKDDEYFEGHEPDLIYVAKRLSDAGNLESILTAAGIDYGVQAEEYVGGVIFRSKRIGAFFYVLAEDSERARNILKDNRYRAAPI